MGALANLGIRIVISEPFELSELNLFGTIKSRRKNSLFVVLSKALEIKDIKSNYLELEPNSKDESLSLLEKYYSLKVNGTLIIPKTKEAICSFTGTAVLD